MEVLMDDYGSRATWLCWIPECDRPRHTRGLCRRHAQGVKVHGNPYRIGKDRRRLFWTHVDAALSGCWEWTAARNSRGYGVHLGRPAYRWAYEDMVGPIPNGLQLDHLCRNPACVNPDHLDPVTPKINTHRMMLAIGVGIGKTHCPQGHQYDEANTSRKRDGRRACKACARIEAARRREAAKA